MQFCVSIFLLQFSFIAFVSQKNTAYTTLTTVGRIPGIIVIVANQELMEYLWTVFFFALISVQLLRYMKRFGFQLGAACRNIFSYI